MNDPKAKGLEVLETLECAATEFARIVAIETDVRLMPDEWMAINQALDEARAVMKANERGEE